MKGFTKLFVIIICIVFGLLYARSCSDDLQNGGIPDAEYYTAVDSQSAVLWEKSINSSIGAFPYADEARAYLSFCRAGKAEIEAWSLTDGERLWRTRLPYSCATSRLPTVSLRLRGAGENLLVQFDHYAKYFPSRRGIVVELNKTDGSIRWELKGKIIFLNRIAPFLHHDERLRGVIVGEDMAYIALGYRLVALDYKTGERKWQFQGEDWSMGELVGDRLYIYMRSGMSTLRVLDAKTGEDLPSPSFPEFVYPRLNQWDSSWVNMPVIGHDRLFFRTDVEKGVQLIAYDLQSGKEMWALDGDEFYPEHAIGGKLYTLYRPAGISRGWSLVKEKLWLASLDEKTGNIDWHVPYEGKNALVYLERKGPHVLAVDRITGVQVHRMDDGSLVWISKADSSADTLDSAGNRLLHITNGIVSLILLDRP